MSAKPLDARTLRWVARRLRRNAAQHLLVLGACGIIPERHPTSHDRFAARALKNAACELEAELRQRARRPSRARPKWSRAKLVATIGRAPSQSAAARSLKGSTGAIRNRCLRDPELKRLWAAAGARGAQAQEITAEKGSSRNG